MPKTNSKGAALFMGLGTGKMVRDSCPVLTPSGWKRADSLKVGDNVIGVDGEPHPIKAIYPQEGLQQIVRVHFSDHSYADVSWDHLWTVQKVSGDTKPQYLHINEPWLPPGKWRVMTTRQIFEFGLNAKSNGQRLWRIPMVAPVKYADQELPIDPYTMGVYLAEGNSTASGNSPVLTLNILDAPDMCGRMGLDYQTSENRPGGALVRASELKNPLRALGLSGLRSWEKFIPTQYLLASVEDRLALLQGLMDGDGSACWPVNEFTSTSPDLVSGLIEIVQSLGGIARRSEGRNTTYTVGGEKRLGRTSWRVNVKLPPGMCPFYTSRKTEAWRPPTKYPPTRIIDRMEEVDRDTARCFSVDAPHDLFVIDQFVVTHNSLSTIAIINLILLNHTSATPLRGLIVCPSKVVGVWPREFARHSTNDFNVVPLVWDKRSPMPVAKKIELAQEALAADEPTIIVVNYESAWRMDELLCGTHWDVIAADESHRFKSHSAKVSKFMAKVASRAEHRLALTGTPQPHNPTDVFAQYKFLNPGIFGTNWGHFRGRYCEFDSWGSVSSYVNEDDLKTKMHQIAYVADESVVELPEAHHIYREPSWGGAAKKAHDSLADESDAQWEDGSITAGIALTSMLRRGQLTSGFVSGATTDDGDNELVRLDGSGKFDELVDVLTDIDPDVDPVVVFCRFQEELAMIREAVDKVNKDASRPWRYAEISGKRSDALTDTAEMRPDVDIVGVQIQAGGVGIDLTRARYVVWFNKTYNYGDYKQATKRVHRPGQTRAVINIHFVIPGTIDEDLEAALNERMSLVEWYMKKYGLKRLGGIEQLSLLDDAFSDAFGG